MDVTSWCVDGPVNVCLAFELDSFFTGLGASQSSERLKRIAAPQSDTDGLECVSSVYL